MCLKMCDAAEHIELNEKPWWIIMSQYLMSIASGAAVLSICIRGAHSLLVFYSILNWRGFTLCITCMWRSVLR